MNPIPANEQERLKALANYHILDSEREPGFDRLAELASLICEAPISLLSLIDHRRQWYKANVGMDAPEVPREITFCQHTILGTELVEVEDATQDEKFRDNPFVTGEGHIRFYAGYPLIDDQGFALGTICVVDRVPRKLSGKQRRALELLGEEAMALIRERRKQQELAHFEKLFTLSNDLVCIANKDGYLRSVNPAFRAVLGWDTDYLLHIPFFSLIEQADVERVTRGIKRLEEGESIPNFMLRLKVKGGGYRILQWVVTLEPGTGNVFAIGRDVTQEKEQQAMLIDSETRFRAFFENSQGLMCTHELSGTFITVNKAGADSIGYTIEELAGKSLYDIIPAEYHVVLRHYLDEIRKKGKLSGLMYVTHKDGSRRTWLFNNILVYSTEGAAYVVGNSTDITERHLLESDLRRTKEALEQTNRVAHVGGWELDLVTNIPYWSPITREIHEVPDDYVPELEEALKFYKEGESKDRLVAAIEACVQDGRQRDMELQIITARGREKWVRVIVNADFSDGVASRLYGTFQDIDEKKRTELEISSARKLLDDVLRSASEVSIIATDDQGLITVFNTGAEKLLGYTAEEMIGKRTPWILHKSEEVAQRSAELSAHYGKKIDGLQTFVYRSEQDGADLSEWTYIRKDGTLLTVSLVMTTIRSEHGRINGYLGIATDITERKQVEQELLMAKRQAEQASVAKSEFLANMSHEIRTPLNGVIGFTDLVLRTRLNETQQQYLSIVNQSANALLGIINDILDFSKIESGKLELDIDKCDLYEISNNASDLITYQAQKRGLEVLLNITPDLPRFIWVDLVRLKQVLVNLMGNAVKFTERGEIELRVSRLEEDKGNGRISLRFEVRDTGIGIHPDKQHKIFEAFLQEDISTTKKYGGTGLGLTISNSLLHLMGSNLQLNSAPGQGSTFYFDLDLRAEYGDPELWEGMERLSRVLIVDDNDNNRMILRQMLLLRGVASDEAHNGLEAIQMLAAGMVYDVIIMDYNMPYMDGLETIRKIRTGFPGDLGRQPAILLHSSSDDETIITACEELQVSQRLVKPVKIQEMYTALSRLFRRQEGADKEQAKAAEEVRDRVLKVLIAEDNSVNLLLAAAIMKRVYPDAEIIEAVNGQKAVALFRSRLPDIVLMDVQMPEMNGYEATALIRSMPEGETVPIIALTAANALGEREKCLKAGMNDFMTKPFVEKDMIVMLDKWLPLQEQQPEYNPAPAADLSHFNYNQVMNYLANDEVMVREILLLALKELGRSGEVLKGQLAAGDLAGLKAAGHKLYGTAVTACFPRLAAFASYFEHLGAIDAETEVTMLPGLLAEIDIVTGLVHEKYRISEGERENKTV